MTAQFQIYKQPDDGAADIDGSSMERGWYWVRTKESAIGAEPIPYGCSYGPFKTKREAERAALQNDARDIEEQVFSIADEILSRLGAQSNGEPYLALASLAVAMCTLARAGDIPVAKVREAIAIADKQLGKLQDH